MHRKLCVFIVTGKGLALFVQVFLSGNLGMGKLSGAGGFWDIILLRSQKTSLEI
jgi:hypothetical protein